MKLLRQTLSFKNTSRIARYNSEFMKNTVLPEVRTLCTNARDFVELGRLQDAIHSLRQAIDFAREKNHEYSIAVALANLAIAEVEARDFTNSFFHIEEAITTFDRLGEYLQAAKGRINFFVYHQMQGRVEEAENYLREALAVFRRENQLDMVATSLGNLALALHERGEVTEAITLLEEAVEKCKASNQQMMAVKFSLSLAELYHGSGDRERGWQVLKAAQQNEAYSKDTRLINTAMNATSRMYMNEERWEEAKEMIEQAIVYNDQIGNQLQRGEAYSDLGNWYAHHKQYRLARKNYTIALKIHLASGERHSEGGDRLRLGRLDLLQARYEEAYHTFYQALEIAQVVRDRRLQIEIIEEIAQCHLGKGEPLEAIACYNSTIELCQSLGIKDETARFETLKHELENKAQLQLGHK